jgi:hypothetical protein
MTPPKLKCKDCGKVTSEVTIGVPNGSCPERPQIYATHRYEVISE